MASPPYNHNSFSSISPPYPAHSQLPQPLKRRQTDMPSSAPKIKRRKASMMSATSASSTHPLRQTSFPPESAVVGTPRYSRSPSVDTTSLVSGSAVGAGKKKRARKSKAKQGDDESAVGGKARSAVSGTSGGRKRRASEISAEEEEEGGEDMAVDMAGRSHEERQKEIEHRAMLTRQFDREQFERFEQYRGAKLPDAVVRRIVNQTLSQSVPHSVILAIKSAAKVFAGDMIEGARKVQTQWMDSDEEFKAKIKDAMSKLATPPAEPEEGQEETRRGPLEPDHLRESYRRYKVAMEGNMVGQLGLWQVQHNSGVERFGTKTRGKRLLK